MQGAAGRVVPRCAVAFPEPRQAGCDGINLGNRPAHPSYQPVYQATDFPDIPGSSGQTGLRSGAGSRGGSTARTNAQAGPTQPSVLRMRPELRCAPEQQRGWSSQGPAPRKGRRRRLLAGGTCLVQGGIHIRHALLLFPGASGRVPLSGAGTLGLGGVRHCSST